MSVYARVQASIRVASRYEAPAVSAHSLLPICTNREQHRAKANNSSSPLKMELEMTISPGRPYSAFKMVSPVHDTRKIAHQVVHHLPHLVRHSAAGGVPILREYL